MKYVALLSGGKDSCYNLLHCQRNGHELVAAASLGPELGKEELDSFLYQTVGQDAIELVARALDVPLHRRVISGTAVEQGAEYGGRDPTTRGGVTGDETEDLYLLLSDVKSQYPDLEGVSVGAILSSYQRVRVEHVCRRLGLTPLCYLWQRNQAELLSEMIDAGMEAILIKVAGIGLTPKHLGRTLIAMEDTLVELNSLYGSHICGEGGEYETLTLDCPLFKQRIRLLETETVIHSDSGFATVAFMRIKNAVLEAKPTRTTQTLHVAIPSWFDMDHESLAESIATEDPLQSDSEIATVQPWPSSPILQSCRRAHDWVAITDICKSVVEGEPALSLQDEVRECFSVLESRLADHALTLSNVANINIFISSMEYFAAMNDVYASFFGISPPARACVAVDLPSPFRVKLDCIAYAEHHPSDRQALHVQSLSYWAPANIGPYSQAINVGESVFISGQIGLIPSSMVLPAPRSLGIETALAAHHADRVVAALRNNTGGGWVGHPQCVIYWLSHGRHLPHVQHAPGLNEPAPTLFLEVKDLPKNALVEKQVLYHTGRALVADDEGDTELVSRAPTFSRGDFLEDRMSLYWEASHYDHTNASVIVLCGKGEGDWDRIAHQVKMLSELQAPLTNALSVRLFHKLAITSRPALYDLLFAEDNQPAVSPIPCRTISTREHDDWDYVICILAR
ncbi:hypothetical protein FA95DRAFT_1680564, partial [Auriscalpium vulgare]